MKNNIKNDIKLVAVDINGTFVHSDYTYDIPRFQRILSYMKNAGCKFVVASGNQYYQLRDLFSGYYDELCFVAENGAFVKDQKELIFTANIPKLESKKISIFIFKKCTAVESYCHFLYGCTSNQSYIIMIIFYFFFLYKY